MTSLQKVIKYCAIAFAMFLTVGIIGGILSAVGSVSFIFDKGDFGKGAKIGEMKTYYISQEVKNLDLNISAANCEVINSNTFKIESNIKNLKISDQNNTLTVKTEKRVGFDGDKLIFKLYIPEHMIFEKVYIVTGVGKMNIKELSADELYFELGAGSAELENIVSKSKAKIDGGAGQLIIKNASLSNAEIDMGVGEFKYSGDLMGKSEIDSGVGAVSLELIGDMLDYEFAIDKGLGNISIDGKKLSDDEIYGSGENKIDLSNGVGEIKVSFDK